MEPVERRCSHNDPPGSMPGLEIDHEAGAESGRQATWCEELGGREGKRKGGRVSQRRCGSFVSAETRGANNRGVSAKTEREKVRGRITVAR